jgi:proline iminopeptidase
MSELFPPIDPYASGMLDVGDGHEVYWEASGNPDGKPAVYIHGGPGSGCSVNQRRFFDPDLYNAILFDQRGCGRSRPLVGDARGDLATNTTPHLVADMEMLRERLGIERWTLMGLSWGSTLALAYAQQYPERVSEVLLVLVTSGSRDEVEWLTQGVARIFPEAWDRFTRFIPAEMKSLRPVDAYAALLFDPDPVVRDDAARHWCDWEDAHVSLTPGHTPNTRYDDPAFRLRFARLVTHYWSNDCFLAENQLRSGGALLNGITGVLINGKYDVSGSPSVAWEIARDWTTSRYVVIDDAGHGGGDSLRNAILSALTEFARS